MTWLDLAEAFAGWVHNRDVAKLIDALPVDGLGDDNGFAVYLGVQCTDVQWPQSGARGARQLAHVRPGAVRDLGQRVVQRPVPLLARRTPHPVAIDGRGVQSALLIDETLDAATPYEGSLEVRRLSRTSA